MDHNVGMTDRMIRIILGVLFVILALTGKNMYSLLWFIPALIAFVTGIVGWCGLYTLFGWNTCPLPKKSAIEIKQPVEAEKIKQTKKATKKTTKKRKK